MSDLSHQRDENTIQKPPKCVSLQDWSYTSCVWASDQLEGLMSVLWGKRVPLSSLVAGMPGGLEGLGAICLSRGTAGTTFPCSPNSSPLLSFHRVLTKVVHRGKFTWPPSWDPEF